MEFRENEFVCIECGEIFIPESVQDPHFEKSDGTECGGSALIAQFLVQFPDDPVVLMDVSELMRFILGYGSNVGHGGEEMEFRIYRWMGDKATLVEARINHRTPWDNDYATDVWEVIFEGQKLFNVWVRIDGRA